jgi:hypothetical protein
MPELYPLHPRLHGRLHDSRRQLLAHEIGNLLQGLREFRRHLAAGLSKICPTSSTPAYPLGQRLRQFPGMQT